MKTHLTTSLRLWALQYPQGGTPPQQLPKRLVDTIKYIPDAKTNISTRLFGGLI